jgi:hypothetical protein
MILLLSTLAMAQAEWDRSTTLALGTDLNAGNFNQVAVRGRLHHGWTSEKVGNDLVVSGFRFWLRPVDGEPYVRAGDDLFAGTFPFRYLTPRVYVSGVARYDKSQQLGLDHRGLVGGGVGFAPVRRTDALFRAGLGVYGEHARFAGDDFLVDVQHTDGVRTLPRVGVTSNGWFSVADTPIGFRYQTGLWLNPLDPQDLRMTLDASMDVKIVGPMSLRVSFIGRYETVTLQGVAPFDIRGGAGLAFKGRVFPKRGSDAAEQPSSD